MAFVLGSEPLNLEMRRSRGKASVSSFIDKASLPGSQEPVSTPTAIDKRREPHLIVTLRLLASGMPAAPLACIVTVGSVSVVELSPPRQSVSSSMDVSKTSLFFHENL